jgi:hypothetical protein
MKADKKTFFFSLHKKIPTFSKFLVAFSDFGKKFLPESNFLPV